jgi:small subunit ribosomal protein S15
MAISSARRTTVINEYQTHGTDSGSPQVQIAVLTDRIRELNEHLKAHKKDYSSRRGLLMMVSKRNRLLRYIARVDHAGYTALIQRLGLRK